IKLNRDPPPEIRCRYLERAAIPADTILWMIRPDGTKSMLRPLLVTGRIERELNRPVVRHIDLPPCRVIKCRRCSTTRLARLHEAAIANELKIARRIGRVTQCKPPV